MNRVYDFIQAWGPAMVFFLCISVIIGMMVNSGRKSAKHPITESPVYRVEVVEGCQYIIYYGIAHKGNCTNSIHTYNQ